MVAKPPIDTKVLTTQNDLKKTSQISKSPKKYDISMLPINFLEKKHGNKTHPKKHPQISDQNFQDKYLPPERVTAELLSPETLRCQPTQPAAPSGIDTIEA